MFAGGVRFHTAVVVVVAACHIYSWFLPMSWVLDLNILLSICRVYIYMFGRLCRATYSFVSTSTFGISHAIQNEKKLWNLHIR